MLQLAAGLIVALVIALEANWLLGLILFICFPFLATVSFFQIKILQGRTAKNKELMEECGKTASEAIENIRTVASLGVEERLNTYYEEQLWPPFLLVNHEMCVSITSTCTFQI